MSSEYGYSIEALKKMGWEAAKAEKILNDFMQIQNHYKLKKLYYSIEHYPPIKNNYVWNDSVWEPGVNCVF